MTSDQTKRWWMRFYVTPQNSERFTYEGPWWVTGQVGLTEDGDIIICAAVVARDESHAWDILERSFGEGGEGGRIKERSFCHQRPDDWNPCGTPGGNSRFQGVISDDGFKWPWPTEQG